MDKLNTILRYLAYRRKAVGRFSIHSPFVYDLYTNVLDDKHFYPEYEQMKSIRHAYSQNHTPIEVIDFGTGAGNKKYESYYRNVSEIARRAGQKEKYSRLLFRLVRYFKPVNILELGTSLGISTSAFALARPDASIHSIEGCSGIASTAMDNFEKNAFSNIKVHIGSFNKILPRLLEKTGSLDFVYFDGNHRREATLSYFDQCLAKVNNDSIFVFDDIYWSKGMQQAWEEIKAHPDVSLSIDIFKMGIVFFRKESSRQDFMLKY